MYSGHVRLRVCLSVAAFPRTNPDLTWRNGRQCPLVVHYWADLQSVHGFRCYDNTARTRNVSECLYSLVLLILATGLISKSMNVYTTFPDERLIRVKMHCYIYNFIRHIGSHIQYKKQSTANNKDEKVNNPVTTFNTFELVT